MPDGRIKAIDGTVKADQDVYPPVSVSGPEVNTAGCGVVDMANRRREAQEEDSCNGLGYSNRKIHTLVNHHSTARPHNMRLARRHWVGSVQAESADGTTADNS